MEQIVEQLVQLNRRDSLDTVGILLPIVLTFILIVQSIIFSCRTDKLQKQIHNRDRINQYHDDILTIYNTYYDFCDTIFNSGFNYYVESGNINLAVAWINNLTTLRISIGRRMDLAKLIFGRSNRELYSIIEKRFKLSIKIIDKYLEYINSGKLWTVSENAWAMVSSRYPMAAAFKYNYALLDQNQTIREDFIKLCRSEEIDEIDSLIKEHQAKHSYESYGLHIRCFPCTGFCRGRWPYGR